jgi:peptidoglycan/xylan/chitin deacetylase (PgdA/CDA1 family)
MGRVSGVLSVLCVVACGGVDTGTSAQAVTGTTIVSLTFDDTLVDQTQVADMAAARGMRVTFFVNSPRLDHAGYMSLADVLAFQAQGHEIGGHTISHADLPTLDLDEAKRQVCNDRVALLADGFAVRTFAYPFGDNNAVVDQIVADCGYNSARDVGGLPSNGSCSGCPFANTVPPATPYAVRTPDSIKIDTTLDVLEGYVLQAEQHGGGWVPLVFHHVCDGCNQLSVSPAMLGEFLDWLAARNANGTVVETMGNVIGGPVQPGVDGPPPDQGPTGLVLQNPSLEVDANNDQIPDCWQRGGSGTNTATFTLENPGFDGNVAQRIDVTSLTSGARRLVSRQDLGACAPTAYPGHSYTVTAYYKSDVQPHFSVYFRDTAGTWTFLAQGPALPASATYVQGRYTTPAYPDGTTAISVGLSILAVGSLTMDELTLVDTDTTPPTVDLTSPADGATVSGTVDVAMTASDAGGLAKVELLINGNATTVAGPPYVYHWDTTQIADSVVGVAVRATDLAGNVAVTPSHLVTIANAPVDTTPPTVAISDPHDGATVRGTIAIAATASDDVAVQRVELFVDGVSIGSLDSAPYSIAWSTASHGDGPAVITARATDAAGNAATSTPVTITVDNTPPVTMVACNGGPCAGYYPGDITVTLATAEPVAAIRYTLDGSDPSTGTIYSGPFVVTASAVLEVSAVDLAGNVEPATATSLVIDRLAPTVSIACNGDVCSSDLTNKPIEVALSATGGVSGVAEIRYTLDGTDPSPTAGIVYTAPFTLTETATVRYIAISGAGVASDVGAQLLQIDTIPPTLAIVSPADGARVVGPVTILAAASDNDRVARVMFFLDGGLLGTRLAPPYSWKWLSSLATTGPHVLTVVAQDAAGNFAIASVTVVVRHF